MTDTPILVLGATGKTGRRVTARLSALGHPVRAASRSSATRFDWADAITWEPALRGTRAAYVVYHPDLAFPEALDRIAGFARLAVSVGTERLVLLSGRGEAGARAAEAALADSGAAWTVVRCSWFSQNFSEDYLLEPVLAGEIALPAADMAEPFVDADDIADVVVAALTGPGHEGQVYELTGPRCLTFGEAAAEIGAALGRDVQYVPVTAPQYRAALLDHGLPAELADAFTQLFVTVLDGRNAHVTDGVQRALGRAPRDFSDYVRTAAAAGAWAG